MHRPKLLESLELSKSLGSYHNDFRESRVDVITIGQYLQPAKHLPVHRFVHPEEFSKLHEIGYQLGFVYVESESLARSLIIITSM